MRKRTEVAKKREYIEALLDKSSSGAAILHRPIFIRPASTTFSEGYIDGEFGLKNLDVHCYRSYAHALGGTGPRTEHVQPGQSRLPHPRINCIFEQKGQHYMNNNHKVSAGTIARTAALAAGSG